MLESLYVKNLALIEEAEVQFGPGLNILSGETGSGKSLLVGSILLALGEKADRSLLREGTDGTYVSLSFSVQSEAVRQALFDLDVDTEEGVTLSRKIKGGRSASRINGEAVSAKNLRQTASLLIDLYGQNDSQKLLLQKNHLQILDDFAKSALQEKKQTLSALFGQYRRLKEEYDASDLDAGQRNRELSFLQFEVQEIESAHLTVGEDERLESDFVRYQNGQKILDALLAAQADMDGGDGAAGASDLIGSALRSLSGVAHFDEDLLNMQQQLEQIDAWLSDFNRQIGDYLRNDVLDEEAFYETGNRLDEINRLKSKYGKTIPDILDAKNRRQEQIERLLDYDAYQDRLRQELLQKENELKMLCEEVSHIRKEKAKEFTDAVREALLGLNFLQAQFDVQFTQASGYSASGTDEVRFFISVNPGEPLRPLDETASGGELSRIMLAIKTVSARADDNETLIFDEIDSGISGRTAQMVAQKLHALALDRQVICITHLPQIAAMADRHFLIEKGSEGDVTHTRIRQLDEEGTISELARLLGGADLTPAVWENAREMRRLSRSGGKADPQ